MNSARRYWGVLCLFLLCALFVLPAGAASTELTVVRYGADGGVAAEETVTYEWMEANLPVQGDGKTHYYHQGPIFEGAWETAHPGEPYDCWDPCETINYETKDMGAVKGTAVRDLCDLVGGMSDGDTVKIAASDGFAKWLSHDAVYRTPSRMGSPTVAWYRAGDGYVPGYYSGMRLVFLADTSTNPDGWHVFGNTDMKETLPESFWHYYESGDGRWPSSTGLSVQYIARIEIHPASSGAGPSSGGSSPDGGGVSWKPETGSLNITSTPGGALIILDGEATEYRTNTTIADLPAADYGISATREGCRSPAEVWVTVPAGGTGRCHIELEQLYAPLLVTAWPDNARFTLDHDPVSHPAGVSIEGVAVGDHSVTVTADGYRPETRLVRVEEETGATVRMALAPEAGVSTGTSMAFGPGPARENGGVPSLSLIDVQGGLLTGGRSVEASCPAGRLYVCLSHGYNSTTGAALVPRFEVRADDLVLFPEKAPGCTVSGTAGDMVAVTGVYETAGGRVTVTGTGATDEVAAIQALCVLAPGGSVQTGWYATLEGVAPLDGPVAAVTLPDSAYAAPETAHIQAVLTLDTDAALPAFSIGGVPLGISTVTRTSRAALVRFSPVPVPEKGAVLVADGNGEALLRLVLVSGEVPGGSPETGSAGPSATGVLPATDNPRPGDRGAEDGWISAVLRWFAGLFGWQTPSSSSGTDTGAAARPVETPEMTPTATPALSDDETEPALAVPGADAAPRLFFPGGLAITSIPSGAAITLDGKATGDMTPSLYCGLKEGLHRVSVRSSATGKTASSEVWVHEGMLVPVGFSLVADSLGGDVTIRSADGEPVAFTVNGAYPLYETPKEVTLTTPVSWVATHSEGGFVSIAVPFSARGGEVVLPAEGTVPAPCAVAVRSDPAGAVILLDGYPTDLRTPSVVEHLSAGVHTVTVYCEGHVPVSREVRLADLPDTVDETVSFMLTPYASGDLSLSSDPPGAKVYLYGRYTGCRTPCTLSGMPIGTYAVGFSMDDGTSRMVDVTVVPDDMAEGTCIFHDLVVDDGNVQTESTEESE
jgi:hypothetical protein